MSKFGFVGPSYTAQSNVIADEECINFYAETNETSGAQAQRSYFGTPGLSIFTTFPDGPVRASCVAGNRLFVFAADTFFEVAADGTQTMRSPGLIEVFGEPVSMAWSNIQVLIVAGSRAYCFTLADNSWVDVTPSLAGIPLQVEYSDGYFIVMFRDSNKFQVSGILDGTTWPGIQVNAVSVFPENIVSIIVSHRELWIFGSAHAQAYQDTGTDEIFDPIPGALVEMGCGATFGRNRCDNTIFWVSQDERGARQGWRANGYTPTRLTTHAVEFWLSRLPEANFANLTSYAYQDGGHLFWVLYVPNSDCSWVYDVAQGLWHKRAEWHQVDGSWGPHRSWNHVYAFGKHLVGDWMTGNLYQLSLDNLSDEYLAGTPTEIRRLRRSPTLNNEMEWVYFSQLIVDFATGLGPQPPLQDGDGNDRPPQAMLRWSNNGGSTWSNQHIANCGFAGEYNTRVIWRRLGRGRKRVFEVSVSDPIPWAIVDAYLKVQ